MKCQPDLIALNALPDTVLRETIKRLKAGQKVAAVARWLMTQHRGALQHEGHYNIRKHVAELKFWNAVDGASAQPQDSGQIDLPDLSPAQQELQKRAKGMTPTGRMLVGDALASIQRLAKLQLNLAEGEAEQDRKQSPPEAPQPAD
jgi:hypothetical protein